MDNILLIFANLVLISAFVWLFDTHYKAYRLDLLRFHIISARERLFEAAESGAIPFDHPAYGMTRQMLNGMIRFAHELGFFRLLIGFLLRRRIDNTRLSTEFLATYSSAVNDLPIHGRAKAWGALAEANMAVFSYALHTSMLLFPFAMLGKFVVFIFFRWNSAARVARRKIPMSAHAELDRLAYEAGA